MSNDRNFRVRHSAPYVERAKLILKVVERRKVRIGDWIVFKTDPKEKKNFPEVLIRSNYIFVSFKRNEKKKRQQFCGTGKRGPPTLVYYVIGTFLNKTGEI